MFRRLRYRNWLVAGLGAATLAIPTTALAGNDLGAKDSWYGYGVSVTTQSRQLSKIDPAIVQYLLRSGFTKNQIAAYSQPLQARDVLAAQLKMDPAKVGYLLRYGFTPAQIAIDSQPAQPGTVLAAKLNMDPAKVGYLLRYGYTPKQIAEFSVPVQNTSPGPPTTVVRDSGFQWDDFGFGLSAAALALIALGLTRMLSNRGGGRPVTG